MRGRLLRLSFGVLGAAMATALAVILVGCTGTDTADKAAEGQANSEPIKIGAVVSLAGTYAGLGGPEKNAIDLEVKRINDAGGVNGRQIEVIYADDATDEAKAVAAASKLIEQDKVIAIIGATGTGQTMAMRSEIDRAAIPQVSMAGGTPVTADPLDPLVYQTPWSNNLVIPYTLEYMKRQGIEKIAIISDSGGFGKDGAAVIKATAPGAGMTVVEEQTFNPGDTDMSAQLTKIKGSGADAMIVVSAGKEAAIVVKNAADLGIKMPMFGTHGNARVEFIDGAGSAAEGFKFAAGKILLPELYGEGTEPFKVATDFKDRYTAAYNKAPDTFAGHAYDAINIIANAANKIDGEVTPKALRDEIEKTSGLIGIGGTFNFTPTDHNGMTTSDLSMYEIKDAAWIEAK